MTTVSVRALPGLKCVELEMRVVASDGRVHALTGYLTFAEAVDLDLRAGAAVRELSRHLGKG